MDLQQNHEEDGQRRLFPARSCRQILSPSHSHCRLRSACSAERACSQTATSFQQPYALKLHRAQKHHFDLRLCYHWIAYSWAIYSMPSHCPDQSCEAVQVEDHLRENLLFEGVHPEGSVGAGPTIVIDKGTWEALPESLDIEESLRLGCLRFAFHEGNLLRGIWSLVRQKDCYRQENPRWILTKEPDAYAVRKDPMEGLDWTKMRSCVTNLTLEEQESDWRLGIERFRRGDSLFPLFNP